MWSDCTWNGGSVPECPIPKESWPKTGQVEPAWYCPACLRAWAQHLCPECHKPLAAAHLEALAGRASGG